MSLSRVERLCEEATLLVRSDLEAASQLAQEAIAISQDERERGQAARCMGIVLWAKTRYEEALERFETAIACFASSGEEIEEARTRSNAMQTLIYLSRYEEALEWANQAKVVFEKLGERTRLARLNGNLANLLYRQDRFEESIALYEEVEAQFRQHGEVRDIAAVMRNKAVCQLSLSRFEDALKTHAAARELCLEHGLTTLVAEADYNIAYLHFLRGDYLEARRLYETARSEAKQANDAYHEALCDLDQAEMYLELNLWSDAEAMAARARRGFRSLGMNYEAAKAQVFLGLCLGRKGALARGLRQLTGARRSFQLEKNAVWPALIDLYAGLLLERAGSRVPARAKAMRGLGFFSQTVLPGKAIQCRLLLAKLDLEQGKTVSARGHANAALRLQPYSQSPMLAGHTASLMAQIEESEGNRREACELYSTAQAAYEALRDRLGAEDLRISYFADKTAAYEAHFLILADEEKVEEAFQTAERSKSRSVEMVAAPKPSLRPNWNAETGVWREQLNMLRHQLEAIETGQGAGSPKVSGQIRQRIQVAEAGLREAISRLSDTEGLSERLAGTLPEVMRALEPGTCLVEYYRAGANFFAITIGNGEAKITRLGEMENIVELLRFVQFQMGRVCRLPETGPQRETALGHVLNHLQKLYGALIAPIEHLLGPEHCVFIPHGPLHWLPFGALHDGQGYLGERFTVSVAPSAGHYLRSLEARAESGMGSAVFGVADGLAPQIRTEAELVSRMMAGSRLYLDEESTITRLREESRSASHLHIATHGQFRRDNPWFSSLRMGDGHLSLYDLHELRTNLELVVLSGCSTGLGVVMGGDEPVGLVRGLLHAGARAALVSLWNVNDESTTQFMKAFYGEVLAGASLGIAVQSAQKQIREAYAHPFFWAAFNLVGWHGKVDLRK